MPRCANEARTSTWELAPTLLLENWEQPLDLKYAGGYSDSIYRAKFHLEQSLTRLRCGWLRFLRLRRGPQTRRLICACCWRPGMKIRSHGTLGSQARLGQSQARWTPRMRQRQQARRYLFVGWALILSLRHQRWWPIYKA